MEEFGELLATVRKTASHVAAVVLAIRHAQLVPPSTDLDWPQGPAKTDAVRGGGAIDGSNPLQNSGATSPGRSGEDAPPTPGGQEPVNGGSQPAVTPLPASPAVAEMQEFADRVDRHRSQARSGPGMPAHSACTPSELPAGTYGGHKLLPLLFLRL